MTLLIGSRKALPLRFFAPAAVAAILLFVYWKKMATYSVGGDDYSLIEASRSFDPFRWFFSGFSDYFYIFQGTAPYTNFVRPIVNLTFWINAQAFGSNIGFYFASSIIFIAAYCYQLICLSESSLPGLLLISLFCLVSPSMAQASLGSPPFGFDVLAATFAFLAIRSCSKRRYLITVAILFCAVFTKEIGLPVCAAFAIWQFWIERASSSRSAPRLISGKTVGYFAPIIAYIFVRALGVGLSGTYATNNLGFASLAKRIALFPFRFPLGLDIDFSVFKVLVSSGRLSEAFSGGVLLALTLNLASFVAVTTLLLAYARKIFKDGARLITEQPQDDRKFANATDALIAYVAIVSSIYLCLMGSDGRFYPVPQGCFLLLLLRGTASRIISPYYYRASLGSLLAIYTCILPAWATSAMTYTPDKVDRVFGAIFQEATKAKLGNILLINAPPLFSSPRYIAKYHRYNGGFEFLYNSQDLKCGGFPSLAISNAEPTSKFSYIVNFHGNLSEVNLGNKCNDRAVFNGYTFAKGADKLMPINVAGNDFYYSQGSPSPAVGLRLKSVMINRFYDGIFVADYSLGTVKMVGGGRQESSAHIMN